MDYHFHLSVCLCFLRFHQKFLPTQLPYGLRLSFSSYSSTIAPVRKSTFVDKPHRPSQIWPHLGFYNSMPVGYCRSLPALWLHRYWHMYRERRSYSVGKTLQRVAFIEISEFLFFWHFHKYVYKSAHLFSILEFHF